MNLVYLPYYDYLHSPYYPRMHISFHKNRIILTFSRFFILIHIKLNEMWNPTSGYNKFCANLKTVRFAYQTLKMFHFESHRLKISSIGHQPPAKNES